MGKSYSTVRTSSNVNTVSTPTTVGAADEALVATGHANINILDEGAIEDAFNFAKTVYEKQTGSVKDMLNFMAIQDKQNVEQQDLMWNANIEQNENLWEFVTKQRGDDLASESKMWDFVGKLSAPDVAAEDFDNSFDIKKYYILGAVALGFLIIFKAKI